MKLLISVNHLRLFLVVGSILLANICAAAAPPPCDCKDVTDILYRIKEANAAIAEYKNQLKSYAAAGTMFTNDEYNIKLQIGKIQPKIQPAQPPPKTKTLMGYTDPHSCNSYPKGGSPCLQEAAMKHESVHSNICYGRKPSSLNPLSDYRDGMTMVAVIQEEITAYYNEIAYLTGEFAKLPDKCKPPIWYLHYEVMVTGGGTKTRVISGDRSQITWKINHKYSGTVELSQPISVPKLAMNPQQMAKMTPQQIIQAMQSNLVMQWRYHPTNATQLYVPFDVDIKDEIIKFDHETGEGGSYEETTKTQSWEGKGADGVSNKFVFEVDDLNKTYNITIPIQPSMQSPPQLKFEEKEVINRTAHGYGGAPLHETPTPTKKIILFSTTQIPIVKGLLENGDIRHGTDLPLKFVEDTLTFDSGNVKPTAPFLTNLPDAEKVKVRVYYRLSKLPVN